MKLIKMLGLAMVGAVSALALVGAGAASAAPHEQIGFCLENTPVLCANTINPPNGGYVLLLAEAENAKLKNSGFFSVTEECKSKVSVLVKEVDKNPLGGAVEELTFSNCKGPCSTAEAKGLPWSNGKLEMSTPLGETWSLVSSEGGALLSGCTFGTKCEYGVPSGGTALLKGSNTAGGAVFKAEGVTLEYKSGSGKSLCGATGTWTAEYKATSAHLFDAEGQQVGLHEPWWLTLLGA